MNRQYIVHKIYFVLQYCLPFRGIWKLSLYSIQRKISDQDLNIIAYEYQPYIFNVLFSWMMSFIFQELLKLSSEPRYFSVLLKKFLDNRFFIPVFAISSSRSLLYNVFQEQSSAFGLHLLQTCFWCQISGQKQEKEWGSIMNEHSISFFIFISCVFLLIFPCAEIWFLCLDSEVSCDHF